MRTILCFISFFLFSTQAYAINNNSTQKGINDITKYFVYRQPYNITFSAPRGLEKVDLVFIKDRPSFVSYKSKGIDWYALTIFNRSLFEKGSIKDSPIDRLFKHVYSDSKLKLLSEKKIEHGRSSGKRYLLTPIASNIKYFLHVDIVEGVDELYIVQIRSTDKNPPIWNNFKLCVTKECEFKVTNILYIPIKFKKPFPNSDYYGCVSKSIDIRDLSPGKYKAISVGASEVIVYHRTIEQIEYALKQINIESDNNYPKWWPIYKQPVDPGIMKSKTRSINDKYFVFWRPGPMFGVYINHVPKDYSYNLKEYPRLKILGDEWLGGFIDIKNFVIYDITGRPIKSTQTFTNDKVKENRAKNNLLVPMYKYNKEFQSINLLCKYD